MYRHASSGVLRVLWRYEPHESPYTLSTCTAQWFVWRFAALAGGAEGVEGVVEGAELGRAAGAHARPVRDAAGTRRGRPPIERPLSAFVGVHVTPEDRGRIHDLAARKGLSAAAYVRAVVLAAVEGEGAVEREREGTD